MSTLDAKKQRDEILRFLSTSLTQFPPTKLNAMHDAINELMKKSGFDDDDDDDFLSDDEDDVSDDDMDVEITDEEEEGLRLLADIFSGNCDFDAQKVQNPAVVIDRDNIKEQAKNINKPGLTPICANPGSGKTSVLPELVRANTGKESIVVVPDEVVLASVCSGLPDPTFSSDKETVVGTSVHYITYDRFVNETINHGCGPSTDYNIFFDEMQRVGSLKTQVMNKFAELFSATNLVVSMYGAFKNQSLIPPPNIQSVSAEKFVSSAHKKILYIHTDQATVDAIDHGYKINSRNFLETLEMFRLLRNLDKYEVHVASDYVCGIDLEFDCVVGPKHVLANGFRRTPNSAEQYQFMTRGGRRGRAATYYYRVPFIDKVYEKKLVDPNIVEREWERITGAMKLVRDNPGESLRRIRRGIASRKGMEYAKDRVVKIFPKAVKDEVRVSSYVTQLNKHVKDDSIPKLPVGLRDVGQVTAKFIKMQLLYIAIDDKLDFGNYNILDHYTLAKYSVSEKAMHMYSESFIRNYNFIIRDARRGMPGVVQRYMAVRSFILQHAFMLHGKFSYVSDDGSTFIRENTRLLL